MNPIFRLGIITAALVMGHTAQAQDPVVTSSLTASRVEWVDGKSVLRPAAAAKPGDVLEYRATYANHGDAPVAHLQATVPIPAGTTFVPDTPVPSAAQASTDAKNFAPLPLLHHVVRADGAAYDEPVPASEIRALRWDVGSLEPGRSTVVRLHVRVNPPVLSQADKP